MTSFLELPLELVIYTLSFLHPRDLFASQAANRFLQRTITDSLLLQYNLETQVACVETNLNPDVTLSIPERLRLLREREEAWSRFQPDFTATIPIPYQSGGIYELSAGLFVLGKQDRQSLGFLTLPSTMDPEPRWRYIDIGRYIVDFAMAVYEHDLLVIVSSPKDEPGGPPIQKTLKIHFVTASTGARHPQAQFPVIDIPFSANTNPSLALEVVGDHFALITLYDRDQVHSETPDHFYIYEWKSGALKLDIAAPNQSYSGLIFLSAEVLLLPNALTERFEFWHIPSSSETNRQHPAVILDLPRLRRDNRIIHISCRGEPNPSRAGSFRGRHPFHVSDSDSILVFNMWLHLSDAGHRSFQLFVHRRALLTVFESFINLNDVPTPRSWDEWGPPITRWFNGEGISKEWITTTCGHRCVICPADAPRNPGELIVLDFNPRHVRRHRQSKEDSDTLFCVEWATLSDDHLDAFVDPIISTLQCIATRSEEKYDYHGVMLDEERLLGIRRDNVTRKTIAIEVLHFG